MQKRILRVNQLIQKELSQIVLKEVEFPSNLLVTITRVQTSSDLKEVKVYVSCLPDDEVSRVLQILGKLVYPLQKKLNKRLKMKPIPRIKFVQEFKTREAGRVEELLEEIKNNY
ncbi:ribosome-binding factor A [Parcubacteria bacterium DG_74_3]|nr:MAG: ribosome-binding factor A [Parcubacteria bacterium DG_74_3]